MKLCGNVGSVVQALLHYVIIVLWHLNIFASAACLPAQPQLLGRQAACTNIQYLEMPEYDYNKVTTLIHCYTEDTA